MRSGGEAIGLIQLLDPRPDRFTPSLIESLEGIAPGVGLALEKIKANDALRRREHELKKGRFTVKDMKSGKEAGLTPAQLRKKFGR